LKLPNWLKSLRGNPYSSVLISPFTKRLGLADSTNYKDYYEAYRNTVYWCVNLRATNVAKAEYGMYFRDSKRNDVEITEDHPFYDLMESTNRFGQTWYDLRLYKQTFLDLVGNAYWYVASRNSITGIPTELITLPPGNMEVVYDATGVITEYRFKYLGTGKYESLNPRDIIHFKSINPQDFYYGMSPLKAASYASDTDLAVSIYTKTFMENDGTPKFALLTKSKLNKNSFDDLVNNWHQTYGGYSNAGMPAVLDNGLDIKAISLTPREVDFINTKKGLRDEIMQVFQIPPVVGNVTENVNRGSSVDGMLNFIDNTIDPLLTSEKFVLESFIKREYDRRIKLRYWIERPSDSDTVIKEIETGIKMGVISVNEARERWGYSPVIGGDEVKPFNPNPQPDATAGSTNQ